MLLSVKIRMVPIKYHSYIWLNRNDGLAHFYVNDELVVLSLEFVRVR